MFQSSDHFVFLLDYPHCSKVKMKMTKEWLMVHRKPGLNIKLLNYLFNQLPWNRRENYEIISYNGQPVDFWIYRPGSQNDQESFQVILDHIYDEFSIFEPQKGTFLTFVGIILLLVGNDPINTDKVLSWADTDNEKYHLFLHFRLVYDIWAH